MSWKDTNNGKTDVELYDQFIEKFNQDETIAKVMEDEYEGEDKPLILEQIASNLSQIAAVFDDSDPEAKDICVQRFRAMRSRHVLDKALRPVCKSTDEDLEKAEVRPFCLYSIDASKLYKEDLADLPDSPFKFARLAIEHEMDCGFEDDSDDEEWEDDDDDEELEDEEDEIDTEELKKELEAAEKEESESKGKGKACDSKGGDCCCPENKDCEDDEEEDFELPFEEDECKALEVSEGFKLLKDHETKLREALEKETGVSIDKFKCFTFPGRHYIVAWLEGLGIFGLRISELYEIEEEDEDEEGKPSTSKAEA
ncbi:hypothetical protein H4219_001308 [Mycoemilia scoparia]|uniref:Uncharacterized protein n=1 Tax=Mycoemilia scoparia TaxID=417184 RepID=A0A9W8A1D5_9FUNG|nr:hypothetical protein H4219_001308 [Mycoemilia scoparia]